MAAKKRRSRKEEPGKEPRGTHLQGENCQRIFFRLFEDFCGCRTPGLKKKPHSKHNTENTTKHHTTMKTVPTTAASAATTPATPGAPSLTAAIDTAKANLAANPNAPHYGDGTTFDSGARYALTDPVTPPVSDGAKVKMDLSSRNNNNLQAFVGNHITQMTGNLNFTDPQPPAPTLLTLYTTFQTALSTWMSAETALRDAISARDAARAALIEGMQSRGAYVQTASNGNRNVILSSGLEVRNAPTPVGQLPPPGNLRAELNGTAGVMKLQWDVVPYATGYLLECSPDVTLRQFSVLSNTRKTKAEKQLATGETYVFRVAASGGSTGQSYYSAEIVRGAA